MLASLILPDRIHGSFSYYDQDLFEQELRRIWRKVWLYVGHEREPQIEEITFVSGGSTAVDHGARF